MIQAHHADPHQFLMVHTQDMPFTPSPGGHVLRKRLHLYGPAESGQVTSLVAYPKGSRFPVHGHPEGEEILVLSGIFSDDAGHWGPGSYLLNPEGYEHAPYSEEGCLILVKLRQYGGDHRPHLSLQTNTMPWQTLEQGGRARKLLYSQEGFPETMCLERLSAGQEVTHCYPGGAELLVLKGSLASAAGLCQEGTWLRLPPHQALALTSQEESEYYLKYNGLQAMRWPQ